VRTQGHVFHERIFPVSLQDRERDILYRHPAELISYIPLIPSILVSSFSLIVFQDVWVGWVGLG